MPGITRRSVLRRAGAALGGAVAADALGGLPQALAAATGDAPSASKQEEQFMNESIVVPTWYYQHHDADYSLAVPEKGFGGWQKADLAISRKHTAMVSMHAWDAGTREEFPGWWRVVPYIPRANAILRDVYPGLLSAIRSSGITLFHVVGGGKYYKELPGYKRAVELAGPEPEALPTVETDPIRDALTGYKAKYGYPATHNVKDIERGFARVDFPDVARPVGDEGVAENGRQLFALCKAQGINHLIYFGFAINWCLLLSPGGMAEMQKYGLVCSALRQATTAVECKESAPKELCKEFGLWRVALAFGFVYDVDDFIAAIKA